MAEQQPVIIIKKIKKGHGGHHGGAWKVAYADFMTAMMAFFLLMWLLNVTTSDQRQGLAEYFAPTGISQTFGGSGGVMGGVSISSDFGADTSESHAPGVETRASATIGRGEDGDEDIPGKSEKGGGYEDAEGRKEKEAAQLLDAVEQEQAKKFSAVLAQEESSFKAAEGVLRAAIEQNPALRELGKYLFIDRTPEGLRIQIVDQGRFAMFPSGSSIPYEKARDLLRLVGKVIARLPNDISITGHTDSRPFAAGSRRDNWGLSVERANISRYELQEGGVPASRISRVAGRADRDPFVPTDPDDSRNRRISIVLLREATLSSVTEKATSNNNQEPMEGAQ
ncbi:MAG: flagellar motor protein MotB [Bdellovibrionales bacterium]